MELVIPYLLILLSSHTSKPDQPMQAEVRVVMSQSDCHRRGKEYIAEREGPNREPASVTFRYFCQQLPDNYYYDPVYPE